MDLQSKGLEFIYIPAVVDRTLEQVLLESLPTMRVKKQNLHEENVEVPPSLPPSSPFSSSTSSLTLIIPPAGRQTYSEREREGATSPQGETQVWKEERWREEEAIARVSAADEAVRAVRVYAFVGREGWREGEKEGRVRSKKKQKYSCEP